MKMVGGRSVGAYGPKKHGDQAHSWLTCCDDLSRIFLTAPPAYDLFPAAVADGRSVGATENSQPVLLLVVLSKPSVRAPRS